LLVLDRRGYWPNPPADGEDFEVDADDVADLLTEPTHLVGHSYGGIAALLAAAKRPDLVRSLTVNEPPAFGVAMHHPIVADFVEQARRFWMTGPADPAEFLRAFVAYVGGPDLPDPLPPALAQNAVMLRNERPPEQASIPLETLRAAAFPTLVVSGAHSSVFDVVCDVLERELAARRAVIPGAGHSVQRTGAAYNEALTGFLRGVVER
jgi:pimeloyl-ACP methyl ester carboxylesterase